MSKQVRSIHFIIVLFCVLVSVEAIARLGVMFQPEQPTLKTIAGYLLKADQSIDMGLYNIDLNPKSPVIQALKKMQSKIRSREITVRLIFEGFGTPEKNAVRSAALETLGVDVRRLASGKKMHHKFAIIDAQTDDPKLITGSANWSLMSRFYYNENVLFMENEDAMVGAFYKQFVTLWNASDEFGRKLTPEPATSSSSTKFHRYLYPVFNTENFTIKGGYIAINRKAPGYRLTREIVRAIETADDVIFIATTRIKLRPIYDALLKAAQRDVKIYILVNMDQYQYASIRKRYKLKSCPNPYTRTCSSGMNFSHFLSLDNFSGHKNISLRVKFYNLSPAAYMSKQMHHKYIIVDNALVWTGSFNWSYSSEYSHIENLIYFNGSKYKLALKGFQEDFRALWDLGKGQYRPFVERLEQALKTGRKTECRFQPMALSFPQIDYLLATGARHRKNLKDACK